jgi:L-ascorbate metabolism protein UlaG (beta-lactamase superfamily)
MKPIRPYVVRALGWMFVALLAVIIAAFSIGACAFTAPPYHGVEMDNFDGKYFRNQDPIADHGFTDFLKWMFTRNRGEWQKTNNEAGPAPAKQVEDLRVTWVNHATVLIQVGGINILTDPIWAERTSPVSWAGPKRYINPGIRFEDLPPIDAVLISHNHYDHLDIETLKQLHSAHSFRVLTGLGNRAFLKKHRIGSVSEMNWWQHEQLTDEIRVTFVPAQHFSGRGIGDRNRTLWGSFVIESSRGTIYFAGDTGWGPHFQQVSDRFGPVRLAILPIGAYQPRWFMSPVHISPEEALEAHRVLGAQYSIGIHYGTFSLADDGQDDPLHDLNLAHSVVPVPRDRFWALQAGESRDVPQTRAENQQIARSPDHR